MAFLNEFKRRAIRRTTEYQVLMEDLVALGVVQKEAYDNLLGYVAHSAPRVEPPPIPQESTRRGRRQAAVSEEVTE